MNMQYITTDENHLYILQSITSKCLLKPLLGKIVKVKSLSRFQLFATPWSVAYQAPPSMGFSRQEYWSGLTFPFPGKELR